jgi:hypothetical protein
MTVDGREVEAKVASLGMVAGGIRPADDLLAAGRW